MKIITIVIIPFLLFCITGCSDNKTLRIYHAAAFTDVIEGMKKEFQKDNPEIDIISEPAGSMAICRKIVELGLSPDIVVLADDGLFHEFLIPQHNQWYVNFCSARIVLLLSEKSKYSVEINSENWMDIILREDVRLGRVNHELGPVGYRTLMSLKLAEKKTGKKLLEPFLEKCGNKNVRPHALELLPLLEAGHIDYCFDYENIAIKHKVKYILIGEDYDLSTPEKMDFYKDVSISIQGKEGEKSIQGKPIFFSFSIMNQADKKEEVQKFCSFFFSEKGQNVMEKGKLPLLKNLFFFNRNKIPPVVFPFLEKFKYTEKLIK